MQMIFYCFSAVLLLLVCTGVKATDDSWFDDYDDELVASLRSEFTESTQVIEIETNDRINCVIKVLAYSGYNENCHERREGFVELNGLKVWRGGWCTPDVLNHRGVNILSVNPRTCTENDHRSFDTSESDTEAVKLIDYLVHASDGAILVGVTGDEPMMNIRLAQNILRGAGVIISDVGIRGSFAFVLQKGHPSKTVYSKALSNRGSPASLAVRLEAKRACTPNPCENDGICVTLEHNKYQCRCRDNWLGVNCETPTSPNSCRLNPCRNGGTCVPTDDRSYQCFCGDDWLGVNCESARPNPCSQNPCKNDGQCDKRELSYAYQCRCSSQWSGPHCESPANNPCTRSPCRNGGTCVPTDNQSYKCFCGDDWQGVNCERARPNPCLRNPCKNGGQCNKRELIYEYQCQCSSPWSGPHCETRVCPSGFTYIKEVNGCYRPYPASYTWDQSNAICGNLHAGAHLAFINSQNEMIAVAILLQSQSVLNCRSHHSHLGLGWWIGGQRLNPNTGSNFVWKFPSGGRLQHMTYTNWLHAQPDGHSSRPIESCIHMPKQLNYGWNDYPCSLTQCFVCEFDL